MPEETTPAAAPAPKRKKSRLLIVVIAVIVMVAGIGGFMFMRGSHAKTGAEAAKPVASGPAQYYTLDPSLVVNFQDKRAIRFLQVGVSLMSHDPKAIDAAKAAEPRIRNTLLLLFSNQDYKTLSTTKGKLALQKEALQRVQAVLKKSIGRPGIQAVYFTSFVMQ